VLKSFFCATSFLYRISKNPNRILKNPNRILSNYNIKWRFIFLIKDHSRAPTGKCCSAYRTTLKIVRNICWKSFRCQSSGFAFQDIQSVVFTFSCPIFVIRRSSRKYWRWKLWTIQGRACNKDQQTSSIQ
jgi:hypothetical protein